MMYILVYMIHLKNRHWSQTIKVKLHIALRIYLILRLNMLGRLLHGINMD